MKTNEHIVKNIEDGKKVFLQESFRVDHPFRITRQIFGPNVLDTEGQTHLMRKREWNTTFGRKNIESVEFQNILKNAVSEGLKYAISKNNLFLVSDYTPNKVILDLLGCEKIDPIDHLNMVKPLVNYLETGIKSGNYMQAKEYIRKIEFYDSSNIFERISTKERENDLSLLVGAGVETTIVSMKILLTAWASNNELFHKSIETMGVDNFIVCLLDNDPPLGMATKYCASDTELGDKIISKGDIVHISITDTNSSAKCPMHNHNNITKEDINETRLTFGHGRHHCPGHLLAKAELKLLAEELLTLNINDFNVTNAEPNYQRPVNFRHPAPLLIVPK